MSISRSLTMFSLFSLFLNSKEDFQRIFLLSFLIAEWFFVDGFIPFYSTFLGFFGCTIDFLHLLPWVPEQMLCQQHWWLIPFLFSHYILLLKFPLKKSSADLPLFFEGGVLRADFQSFLPKAFRCHFSDPPFGCFIFCHFL